MNESHSPRRITLVGAGLAGTLLAILLAKRGFQVELLEQRPDPRKHALSGGRSINLALADRGIHALKYAGIFDSIKPLLLAMPGRMLHDIDGATRFIPYGQRDIEQIYSVSRAELNCALLDEAERFPGVTLRFQVECTGVNFAQRRIEILDTRSRQTHLQSFEALIGADGAGSNVRQALIDSELARATSDILPHGYKELTLPADRAGRHRLDPRALHIWPRGNFMLIALPNLDGSFTVTLFFPSTGPESFASLQNADDIESFFRRHFLDAATHMPHLAAEFLAHPTGHMGTIDCDRWTDGATTLLIGDAAHAIVPFHGQGMNCAFEDCIELDAMLADLPFQQTCKEFQRHRKANTDAIADMALENYIEMRDTVRAPKFLLQKELSFELERRYPDRFIPRYSMVMFHHEIPYAEAYERGQLQSGILEELTRDIDTLENVDMSAAEKLVQQRLEIL